MANGSKSLTFENENSFIYKNTSPEDSVNIADRVSTEKYIKKILAGLGLSTSDYITDTYVKNQDDSVSVVLMEKYKNFVIYDNSVEASVTKKGVTYLKSKFKKIKGFASDKKVIIPANLILLKSYGETQNMEISGVDIGFMGHVLEQDTKESYENPVWRIRIKDGSERFFNAYNGEEIK